MTEHPFLIRIEILPALEITQEYYMRLPFPHIILFALLISSCKKDVGYVNYGNYPAEIGKIISQNCSVSGCHNEKSYPASANYNLTSWKSMFAGSSESTEARSRLRRVRRTVSPGSRPGAHDIRSFCRDGGRNATKSSSFAIANRGLQGVETGQQRGSRSVQILVIDAVNATFAGCG